jgi:hypothetical protein
MWLVFCDRISRSQNIGTTLIPDKYILPNNCLAIAASLPAWHSQTQSQARMWMADHHPMDESQPLDKGMSHQRRSRMSSFGVAWRWREQGADVRV